MRRRAEMLTRRFASFLWLAVAAALAVLLWYFVAGRNELQRAAGASGQEQSSSQPAPALPPPAGPSVLVLYDAPAGKPEEKLGLGYAIMVGNLLGHFDARVQLMPVNEYAIGRMQQVDATFYLGTAYNSDLPQAFVHEALRTTKPLVWIDYNLWKLRDGSATLAQARGFSFVRVRGFDAKPSRANPQPGFFDTISYKGLPFKKYYRYDPAKDVASAEPDVGQVTITDPNTAKVLVTVTDSRTGETVPYVVRSGSFWYVADLPLSFIGPRDRYLVFADLLHDMLGINHPELHRAMIRLEDIHAMVDPASIQRVVDYLHQKSIPFSLAVIPHYRDPRGIYNRGTPQDIPLSRANSLRRVLDYAVERGGEIVAHGYTHQYDETRNPVSGVSAEDYEFWDAVRNRPLAQDSTQWTIQRLRASLEELRANGYTPVAWTTPHYQGSPTTFRAVPRVYATTYQRVTYYSSDRPDLVRHGLHDYVFWQFYPYVIARDHYGQRVIPENIGNVQYMVEGRLTGKSLGYSYEDLLTNARYALAVRDGFASFFFHPFLLDVRDIDGWQQLTRTVDGIAQLGYVWTSPKRLEPGASPQSAANPVAPGPRASASTSR
jgi:uncharacterized protein YdaL